MEYVIGAGIILFIVLAICASAPYKDGGLDENFGSQRIHGKSRVLYPDGLSQPMNAATAKQYAEMFDGQVVSRDFKVNP